MRTFTPSDLQSNFAEILAWIRSGEKAALVYGASKEIIAYLIPSPSQKLTKRPLGLLAGKATVVFADDFKMTEEQFLGI